MPDPKGPVDLSIVIPVYNEERRVGEALRRIQAFMQHKKLDWEILVSDDGSSDNTQSIVEAAIKKRADQKIRFLSAPYNQGKGAAVKRGMLEASGKWLLMTDVDLSAPIKEVDRLIAALNDGADVAIGSRAIRENGCDVQQSFIRKFSGRVFNWITQSFFLRGFLDTQCGFKCFKAEAAKELFRNQTLNGFCFDVEILYLANQKKFRIKEVPVMWRENVGSKVKLSTHSIAMLKELFYLRRHYLKKSS